MSVARDSSNERMRFLLYETNEFYVQKFWSSYDEEVIESLAKKEFQPLSVIPHLVESLREFLKRAVGFSNLDFSVTLLKMTMRKMKRTYATTTREFTTIWYFRASKSPRKQWIN